MDNSTVTKIETIAPLILSVIPGASAYAEVATAAMKLAELFGNKGSKKDKAVQIARTVVTAVNTVKKSQVLDPDKAAAIIDQNADYVMDVVNDVKADPVQIPGLTGVVTPTK